MNPDLYHIGSCDHTSAIHRGAGRRSIHFCFDGSDAPADTKNTQSTNTTQGANSPFSGGSDSPVANASTQILLGQGAHIDASPAVETAAFQAIQQVVQQALGNQGDTTKIVAQGASDAENSLNSLASEVLNADQATAANTASGGQTNENKTVLYLVLAACAAIAAIFIFKK